ncbi:MAG: hypothetical protein M3P44_05685 [Actinomycetota bacterium]|nr:hypothetical protein [Actinomycetota bacterium]
MTDGIYPLFPTETTAPERPGVSTYVVTGCAGFIGSHLTGRRAQRSPDRGSSRPYPMPSQDDDVTDARNSAPENVTSRGGGRR